MTGPSDAHARLRQQVDGAPHVVLWGAVDRLLADHGPRWTPPDAYICLPCSVRYPCYVIQRITEAIDEGP